MPSLQPNPTATAHKPVPLELGEVYYLFKFAEDEKGRLRKAFFELATAANREQPLARKVVVADDATGEGLKRLLRYHPGWCVVDLKEDNQVILEEDPAFKPWSEVVETTVYDLKSKKHPGYVITRSIVSGSPLVDDERIRAEDPDFFDAITDWQYPEFVADLSNRVEHVNEALKAMGWSRVLRPVESLTAEQTEQLMPYVYEGPKTVKLMVRYAKDEDLASS